MENLYILMITTLGVLAVVDIVVGVSNDAVNFLNSAIGSKVFSYRKILMIATLGVLLGAVYSSGMMEVARKGIFNPSGFYFNELMIIFMTVMLSDIILLDFFNTLGMPTSTTVSIVFNLLGASIAMALIKIFQNGESIVMIDNYINSTKAIQIISGILLSVIIAFSIGGIVQWVSRFIYSFKYKNKGKMYSVVFGAVAMACITYFIFLKGLKGSPLANLKFSFSNGEILKEYLKHNSYFIIGLCFIWWVIVSAIFTYVFRWDIFKIVIGIGTFALALAFAGNDLVNFIGVPIAAFQSYKAWVASGIPANEFNMSFLAKKLPTPTLLLFLSGLIMVLTLFLSKKAKSVTETEINLSRGNEIKEKFEPNFLSRGLVRVASSISDFIASILPHSFKDKIETSFEKPTISLSKKEVYELPAFDVIRASVNLMVASILISIATNMKLPLSTTYVTFMVAMGTSLADRAWGAESAVYRVAGVLHVIGGWFMTAFIALLASGTMAFLIMFGGEAIIVIFILLALGLLIRNYMTFKKKSTQDKEVDAITRIESKSIKGVIDESASNIAKMMKKSSNIYESSVDGLNKHSLKSLKKSTKQVKTIIDEIDEIRNNVFYFIKNLDDTSVSVSTFYINIVAYLQDITQSLDRIFSLVYKHLDNNHKKLNKYQITDIEEIKGGVSNYIKTIQKAFSKEKFEDIDLLVSKQKELISLIQNKIDSQIERTRKEEVSPKNTTLYFSILLETKDLVNATMNLLQEYNTNYITASSVE